MGATWEDGRFARVSFLSKTKLRRFFWNSRDGFRHWSQMQRTEFRLLCAFHGMLIRSKEVSYDYDPLMRSWRCVIVAKGIRPCLPQESQN